MIYPADTSITEMSTFTLQLLAEEIEEELSRRHKKFVCDEMTKLWKAIEDFQKNEFAHAYITTTDGRTININTIGEVFDDDVGEGFSFGPWIAD